MPDFTFPPKHICILRLSAIGDICHTLPIIRTIQAHWPDTKITWIIGKTEYELIKGIDNIDFIIFNKKFDIKEYFRTRSKLKNINFDVLLHMQMSLRASLISLMIKAKIKIGFDRKRAKDGQWLFTNKKIKALSKQHVMDSLFGFSQTLGIKDNLVRWDIPVPETEQISAKKLLCGIVDYVAISPCSSKVYRNWHTKGYAAVADYIKEKYNINIVLTGGNTPVEIEYGKKILEFSKYTHLNLIGSTNLKELLYIIDGSICMISPDSGPAHMATAMNTPVIGLYATTNPDRARPYLSANWTVNRYPDAIYKKYNKKVNDVAWGTRVRDEWAMNMITVEDVTAMIDNFFQNKL